MDNKFENEKEVKAQKAIEMYHKMIYKIAFGYLKIESDAEDIVQEVLIKYVNNEKPFVDENHERNWIIRVTLNLSHNMRLSAWKRYTVALNDNIPFKTEIQHGLFESLNLLKDKYKDVVVLYYMRGMKIKEISEIVKISEENVKTRLKRARKMIEEIVKEGEMLDE